MSLFAISCEVLALGILFGVLYPLGTILFYPVYKFCGGRNSFKKYMKNM